MRKFASVFMLAAFLIVLVAFTFSDNTFSLVFTSLVCLFSGFVFASYIMIMGPDHKVPKHGHYPPLTIIIPSYNMEKTIEKSLRHICAMKYASKIEYLVIDDASTDKTVEIAEKFPVKIIVRKQNKGKAAALNFGISQAKGELVACIDSDTYPPEDLLMKSVPYLSEKDCAALTFFITVAEAKTIWQKMQEVEYYSAFGFAPHTMEKVNGILVTPGPLTIFRKEALVKIKGFAEDNITEDFEMGLKLISNHYKILYLAIKVPTEVPATFKGFLRQRLRWYRGTIYNINLYRRLLFNKEYKDSSMFAFPVTTSYVLVTFVSFFFVLSRFALTFLDVLPQLTTSWKYGAGVNLIFDPFYFKADSIMFALYVIIWIFFITRSISLISERITIAKIPGVLMVFFVYPFLNSFLYIYALYQEISGSEQKW